MPDTFHAQILTPEGTLFEGEVTGVQAPGELGSFEMRVNHAPIISSLGVGHLRIEQPGSEPIFFAVSGGFVEMSDNKLTLLSEAAERVEDIDVERAMRARKRAMERLMQETSGRLSLEHDLQRAENRLRLIDQQS